MSYRAIFTNTLRWNSRPTQQIKTDSALAASITRAASKQTYYTVQLLVDRERVTDAYRAYAYFRWLDDTLDQGDWQQAERMAFVRHEAALIERCFQGKPLIDPTPEEALLAALIDGNRDRSGGLYAYIHHMMAVMAFDAERRGRLISHQELIDYERHLATAVTEALHYFIGHDNRSPQGSTRYLAATGAHITHMLRDAVDDTAAGYFNIPRETLESHGITAQDIDSPAYRAWVRSRVHLARAYFQAGKDYLAQVENPRCRLAGTLYIARFEGLLDTFLREGCALRLEYPERKSAGAVMRLAASAFRLIVKPRSSNFTGGSVDVCCPLDQVSFQ